MKHRLSWITIAFFAAMVSKLDESVGCVLQALREKDMLQNSIVLFMADNGAPTIGLYETTGSNYPFRGVSKYAVVKTLYVTKPSSSIM